MAAGDTAITIVGNLVADPELRYTPTGQAVATFRVASTPRFMDRQTNEWKDGDSLFLSCNVWRQAAENVAESLQRGMRSSSRAACGSGRTRPRKARSALSTRSRSTRSGPSLRSASAKVTKSQRRLAVSAALGGSAARAVPGGQGGYGGAAYYDDPWASDARGGSAGDGGFTDEPPSKRRA